MFRDLLFFCGFHIRNSKMKPGLLFIMISLVVVTLAMKLNSKDEIYKKHEVYQPSTSNKITLKRNAAVLTNENHNRYKRRQRNLCEIPRSPDTSKLKCSILVQENKVLCNLTCVFGHTFPEGTERKMTCNMSEGLWYPMRDFEPCKPFVDCKLSLGSGAKSRCFVNYMDKGPECEISCKRSKDKKLVLPAIYRCDIEGKWTPELPFCAKPSGKKLTSRPMLHGPVISGDTSSF